MTTPIIVPLQFSTLRIDRIRRDGGTQSRVGNSEETIELYAEAMRDNHWVWTLDSAVVVVVDSDGQYWLADGFHRIEAAIRAGWNDIRARVATGDRRDAVLYAAGANARHGLHRTREDVRRSIRTLLLDEEWRQWSNAEIARRCATTDKTVDKVRTEMEASSEIPRIDQRTVVRNGSTYQQAAPAQTARQAEKDASEDRRRELVKRAGTLGLTTVNYSNRTALLRAGQEIASVSGDLDALEESIALLERVAATEGQREQDLIARAEAFGYTVKPYNGGWRLSRGESPMGGVKSLDDLDKSIQGWERHTPERQKCKHCGYEAPEMIGRHCLSCESLIQAQKWESGYEMRWRLDHAMSFTARMPEELRASRLAEIRSVAEANGIDLDAQVSAPSATEAENQVRPPVPPKRQAVLARHAKDLWAGIIERSSPAERRLLFLILYSEIELDAGEIDDNLWNIPGASLDEASEEDLAWLMEE